MAVFRSQYRLFCKCNARTDCLHHAYTDVPQAVASMSSSDHRPKSLMSRNRGDGQVITGGRSLRHHRGNPSFHHSTWVANPVDELDAGPAAKRAKKNRIPRLGQRAASDERIHQEKVEQEIAPAPRTG